jgi:hypothetical protein
MISAEIAMPRTLQSQTMKDVVVIRCRGRIVAGAEAEGPGRVGKTDTDSRDKLADREVGRFAIGGGGLH